MTATLITGANVWDGISDQPVPQQVLVVDGRIQHLGGAIEPVDTYRASEWRPRKAQERGRASMSAGIV